MIDDFVSYCCIHHIILNRTDRQTGVFLGRLFTTCHITYMHMHVATLHTMHMHNAHVLQKMCMCMCMCMFLGFWILGKRSVGTHK